MNKKQDSFSSRIGFVLAAAGSAIGLGNLWRFPYLAARYGGGIFLFIYIILAITFGFTLLISEIAIGRKTKLSCIKAYKTLSNKFAFLGPLAAIVPMLILPFYCMIGGWILKYLFEYLTLNASALCGDTYFSNFMSMGSEGILNSPIFWMILFVVITAAVVRMGVKQGIEKTSTYMMPVLFVLCFVIAIFSLSIPGAIDGLKYYLVPDFSKFSTSTVLGAMGQLFFSMSLAMGIMITYGSYVNDEDNLEKSVNQIEILDTFVAVMAGLMIIPAFVAFNNGDVSGISAGPGLMFGVLPKVFETMPMGGFVGFLFFLLVFVAALTSSVSILETCQSIVVDQAKVERKTATLGCTIFALVVGIILCLGYGPLADFKILSMQLPDFFDFLTNSVLMPIIALLTCILIGYVIKPESIICEITKNNEVFKRQKMFTVMIKYIAPICLILIILSEFLKYFNIITI